MEEELISFETAKLAKEKGFSNGTNGCLVHYKTENKHHEDGTSGPFGWKKDEMTFDRSYIVNGREDLGDLSNNSYDCYERPTQSLLQKWLREKHNIHVDITTTVVIGSNDKVFYKVSIIEGNLDNRFHPLWDIESDVYEEVLEKGLQEALKLI